MKRTISFVLALVFLTCIGPAFASSGGASASTTEPCPVFESSVCVLQAGEDTAEFVVKGYQNWNDGDYLGIAYYDAGEELVVYEGYDAWQDGQSADVGAALSAVAGSSDLLLSIPAASLTENTVYYISIAGDDPSPVYIVTAANAAAVDADNTIVFDLGSSEAGDGYTDSFTLPLSSLALVPTENCVRKGGAYGLFTAASYSDVDEADAEAVDWYLSSGGTNGGLSFTQFGSDEIYARLDAAHYVYRFFCFEGSGGFGMFSDVGNARWFSGSSGANTAYAFVDILGHTDEFDSYRAMTVQDMVVLMYNSITTPFSSRSEAGDELCAALKAACDGTGAEAKVAAMAALDRFDAEAYPDLSASCTKLDAVRLFAKGLGPYNGEIINAVRTQLDSDFVEAVNAAGEAGELDGFEDAGAELDCMGIARAATLTAAQSAIITDNEIIENGFWDNEGIANASALIVEDGAVVTLVNSRVASSGSNPSDTLQDRDYRFGYGAGLLAVDPGTVVKIFNTDGALNTTGASNGSMAGCMFTGTGSVIYAENGQFYSAGQHPSNTCYDGTLIYNGSTLTGGGRTFSTDFFGGKVIFYNSVSNQLNGNGFVIDESTSYFVVNSYVYGGSSFETNGQGQAYYQNSYVYTKGSWVMQNNTSMRSDYDYVCGVNTTFRCTANTFLTVQKEEKAVVTFDRCNLLVGDGSGSGYVVKVSGDEWQTSSALELNLVETDFPEGQVFVGGARDWPNQDVHTDGTCFVINTDGQSALNLTQVVTDTVSITTYEDGTTEVEGRMGTNYATDIPNTGVITLNGVETGLTVADGVVLVTNGEYADVTVTDEAVTAVYTVNGATVTLVYELNGEAVVYESASGETASAEPAAAEGGWDAWLAYLNELLDTDPTLDIYDMVKGELAAAQESDYAGMLDGTVFGVFANLYDAIPYEEF